MIINSSNLTDVGEWSELLITSVVPVLSEDNTDMFVNAAALLVIDRGKSIAHL